MLSFLEKLVIGTNIFLALLLGLLLIVERIGIEQLRDPSLFNQQANNTLTPGPDETSNLSFEDNHNLRVDDFNIPEPESEEPPPQGLSILIQWVGWALVTVSGATVVAIGVKKYIL